MLLGIQFESVTIFRLQDYHFLWLSVIPTYSSNCYIPNPRCNCPTTLIFDMIGLGFSHFARRYFGNRFYFLFL